MQEVLGPHPNSHVIYPMPGRHQCARKPCPRSTGKFRLVYVGSVQNFYGRMLCALIEKMERRRTLEIIVVGPNADWPVELLERAKDNGVYVGFKSPEQAAMVMASADALLVGYELREGARAFYAHEFHHEISGLCRIWKTCILWGPVIARRFVSRGNTVDSGRLNR